MSKGWEGAGDDRGGAMEGAGGRVVTDNGRLIDELIVNE